MTSPIPAEHPSYGNISISKISGGAPYLYMSPLNHSARVRITISQAEFSEGGQFDKALGSSRSKSRLIEVDLAFSQFAQLLMSQNTLGVPCTITSLSGNDRVEEVPRRPSSLHTVVKRNVRDKANEATRKLRSLVPRIDTLLAGKTVKKTALRALRESLLAAVGITTDRLPYITTEIMEGLETLTTAALSEVAGTAELYLKHLGLNTQNSKMPVLEIDRE